MEIPANPDRGARVDPEIRLTRVGEVQRVIPMKVDGQWRYITITVNGDRAGVNTQNVDTVKALAKAAFADSSPSDRGTNLSISLKERGTGWEVCSHTKRKIELSLFNKALKLLHLYGGPEEEFKHGKLITEKNASEAMRSAMKNLKTNLRRVYVEGSSAAEEGATTELPAHTPNDESQSPEEGRLRSPVAEPAGSPPSGAPPEEQPLDTNGVVFAKFNQTHFPDIQGWGGPCTYCSLEFIAESLRSPAGYSSDKVGQITTRGATTYKERGNAETVTFTEAYRAYPMLEKVSEHLFRHQNSLDDDAHAFGIKAYDNQDNPWQDAVDALDKEGDDVGAVITINCSRYHTYGLVKKEGVFTFYDSHGEPRLGATSAEGDHSPPAYTKTFDSKEALIAYLSEIRKVGDDWMVYVNGIDVNVVRLKP